jgi:hypothetical protein
MHASHRNWLLVGVVAIAASTPLLAQATGKLKVKVNPGRTGIFLDGKYLGPAANFKRARTYEVPVGEHELILREPRYQDHRMTVTVVAGKKTTISTSMQPRPLTAPPHGVLRVVGFPKYAAVYVNGAFMGHADEFDNRRQGLLLNPRPYQVRVVDVDGSTLLEQNVTIREKITEILRK